MNCMDSVFSGGSGKKKIWSIEPFICFICKRSGKLRVPRDQGKRTFTDSLIKIGDCNSVKVEEREDWVINFESKIFDDDVSSKIR